MNIVQLGILKTAVTIPTLQTSLTIDGSLGEYYRVELSANAAFSLSNIAIGKFYYFRVKNTGASAITITLPNTADIKESTTATISASKYKDFAFIYDGTIREWQISAELT